MTRNIKLLVSVRVLPWYKGERTVKVKSLSILPPLYQGSALSLTVAYYSLVIIQNANTMMSYLSLRIGKTQLNTTHAVVSCYLITVQKKNILSALKVKGGGIG